MNNKYKRKDKGLGGVVYLHRTIDESALGRKLGPQEHVHHINGDKKDNRRANLLICTNSYHRLIHQRDDALMNCGNANYRKCQFCKKYSDPRDLYIGKKVVWHRACQAAYRAAKYKIRGDRGVCREEGAVT